MYVSGTMTERLLRRGICLLEVEKLNAVFVCNLTECPLKSSVRFSEVKNVVFVHVCVWDHD